MVPVTSAPGQDLFFLSFDQLGSHVHAYVDPPVQRDRRRRPTTRRNLTSASPPSSASTTRCRAITGVPITNSMVSPQYKTAQQSMPATPLIAAFVSAQPDGDVAAGGRLLRPAGRQRQSYRDAFFGTGLDASLNSSCVLVLRRRRQPRTSSMTALVNNAVGSNVTPQTGTAVTNEVDALLQLIPTLAGYSNATVSTATRPRVRRGARQRRGDAAVTSRISESNAMFIYKKPPRPHAARRAAAVRESHAAGDAP